MNVNNSLKETLQNLLDYGSTVYPRQIETKEIINYNIVLENPKNRIITIPSRNMNLSYLLGEFIWYLSGTNTIDRITPYSAFWKNITNEDGTINSNYGYYLFNTFVENNGTRETQFENIISTLARDKDSRQALVNIHMPYHRTSTNKDVPCTLTLQFFIRQNENNEDCLSMIVNMRSNDIILGYCNDVFQFTMLQECVLLKLKEVYPNLKLGLYFHNAGSMHLYSRHYEMAAKIVQEDSQDHTMISMDVFDERTVENLVIIESKYDKDLDNSHLEHSTEYMDLSPYWQKVVSSLLFKTQTLEIINDQI